MNYPKLAILILLNVISFYANAQNKLTFKETNVIQTNLSQHFEHYKILEVNDSVSKLYTGATVDINYLNNFSFPIRENKLLSSNFLLKTNTPNGIEQKSIYNTDFDGKYFMNSNFSISKQFIFSSYNDSYTIYIKDSLHDFYIEPLANYIPNSSNQFYVYYNRADVKQKNVSCADTTFSNTSVPQAQVLSGGCFQTELAIACDYSMYQLHGSINNVLNRVLTITNLVNGDYTIINGLTDNVNFKVVEFYLPICDSCNPWQYTNNLYSILFNFQGGSMFTNSYDLAQYWNVGYSGPIGIALLSGVCGSQKFNVCADYSGLNDERSLSSHEIGHNFGCQHDVSVLNIMYPQNYGMSNWTSQSVSEIGNTLNTVSCLATCPTLQQCDTQSVQNLMIITDTIQHWAKATWTAVSGVSYKVRWYNYTTTTWTSYTTLSYPIDSAVLSIPASVNCSNKYRFEIIPICGTTVGNSYQIKFIYNKIHDINNLTAIKNGNGIKLSWSPSIYTKHVEIVNNVLATSQFYTVPIGIDTFHFAFPTSCADTSFTCKVGNQCDTTHIGNLSSLTVLRTFPNLQTTNPFCPPMSVMTNLPNTSNIGYTINWVNNTNSTTNNLSSITISNPTGFLTCNITEQSTGCVFHSDTVHFATILPSDTWTFDKDSTQVAFTSSNPNCVSNYYWDFGDATSSTLNNVTHTYLNYPQYYNVCHKINNTIDTVTSCDNIPVFKEWVEEFNNSSIGTGLSQLYFTNLTYSPLNYCDTVANFNINNVGYPPANSHIELNAKKWIPKTGTLEFRVKIEYGITNLGIDTTQAKILTMNNPVTANWIPYGLIVKNNGDITFTWANGTAPVLYNLTATPFRFHEWHTVSISYGSQGLKVAVDGLLQGTNAAYTQPNNSTLAWINMHNYALQNTLWGQFSGQMNAFRISYRQADWQLHKRYKTPTITITQNNGVFNQVCAGDTSKFSASCANCGTNYTLQWKVNGNNVGTNSTLYNTTTINNNDIVTCQVYNGSLCPDTGAVSNPIQAVVNNPPTINLTSNSPVCLADTISLFSNAFTNNPYRIWRTNSMVTYTITPTVLVNNGINYSTTNFNGNLDNGVWKNVNVPFSFKYFNNTYNKIHINTNGYVSFGIDTGYNSSVTFIPNSINQNNYIGGPWADLDLSTSGKIEYGIFGTAPNRIFMIRYYAPTIGFTTDIDTSAIYINETSNVIRVAWKKYNNSISWPMTIGLEDSTGTRGVAPFDVNNNYISENPTDRMYYFYPNPLTYSWSGPSSFTSTAQNPVILNSSAANAGNYTLNVTDASGCTNSASINVSVGTFPISISAVPNDTICAGTSVSLTASGATTYSWSGGITNGVGFTPTTSGTYTVTATNASGCSSTSTIFIQVKTVPTVVVNTSPNDSICMGSPITLTAAGGGTYSWTGGITNGVAFAPSTSNVYTVTVTGANGCTKTQSQAVSVNSLPTVSILVSPNDTVCSGTNTMFTASGGTTYSWTGGITNGVGFTPNSSSVYTVTVSDAIGCSKTQTQMLTVKASPILNVTVSPNDTVCMGSQINLDATGGATYTWSGGITNNVAFLPTANTTYTVTASGSNGCTLTQTHQIVVNALPIVSISILPNDTLCAGDLATMTAYGGTTYNWSGSIINGSTFGVSATNTFSVVVTDANGCSSTANQTIVVKPNLTPSLSITSNPLQGVTNDPVSYIATTNIPFPYQIKWYRNNVLTYTGTSNSWNDFIIAGNNSIYAVLLSPSQCLNPDSVISNSIKVSNVTGLQNAVPEGFTIYPNPTEHQLMINGLHSNDEYIMYDAIGNVVLSGKADKATVLLDVNYLAAGVYQIQFKRGTTTWASKILKQ